MEIIHEASLALRFLEVQSRNETEGSVEIREDLIRKSTFSFGHCPNKGGLPMPKFVGPFF